MTHQGTPEGGGVALIVHKSLKQTVVAYSKVKSIHETEYMIVKITDGKTQTSILVGCVYRPPRAVGLDNFFDVFARNRVHSDNFVVVGDFNSHLQKDCRDATYLRTLASAAGLTILDTGESYHEPKHDSWLDVVMVDDCSKVRSIVKSDVPFIDHHDSFLLNYAFEKSSFVAQVRPFRNFKRCNFDELSTDIVNIVRLHSEPSNLPVNDLLVGFNADLISALDQHAPVCSVKTKPNYKPWMNEQLKQLIHKRNRFYKIYKKTNSLKYKTLYRNQSKLVNAREREDERQFYVARVRDAPDNSSIYRILGQMGYTSRKKGAKTAFDFFAPDEIIQHIAQTYSVHPPCEPDQCDQIIAAFPIEVDAPSFEFQPIPYETTLLAFKRALLTSKGNSPDGLQLKHLAQFLPYISIFFTTYYNLLLDQAEYPALWKMSLIIPMLKKSKPTGLDDIRPITNLCHCAKPFDSIISKQISAYFEQNSIFSEFQSGGRPGFSTHLVLAKLINDARAAIDRDEITLLMLYDFRKAFNFVDHSCLIEILRIHGFSDRAIRFVQSYLAGRCMACEGSCSCDYTCGVGQGSGPGCNFFLAFINSVFSCFMYFLVLLFIDDAQGFMHFRVEQANRAIERANADSQSLVDWSNHHGLPLNPDKTLAIMIGSRANLLKLSKMQLLPLLVDGQVVKLSNSVKSLGLTISEDLRWNSHVMSIISSTNRILYFLNSKARGLPISIKKQIASQLLFPHFDYACTVFIDVTKELGSKLDNQLDKAVRFVFGLPRKSPTASFRRKLNWLTLYQRRQYFLLSITFRVLKFKQPAYLYNLLSPHLINRSDADAIRTRNNPVFLIPNKTCRTMDSSFCIAAMRAWNDLPEGIRELEEIALFKARIKSHLNNNT